ncbi:amino acid permease [Botrytis cinerea]
MSEEAGKYPEKGERDGSNTSSISRSEQIAKAAEMLGVEKGETISADDELLASLGYRAELKREFSYTTVFGQSFGSMGIAPAIAESMVFSLGSAGSVGMWVARLTPPRQRAFMCWLAGYMNVLGYISIYASTIYAATLILGAICSINTDSVFVATKYQNYGIFVFADFQNTGFWTNNGWAFMLSFLTPVWVVSGFESAATIAEEASNAAKAVPFAMVSSLVTATVTGWAVIITIAFCMGTDVIGIVTSPLGQPLAQIAFNSLGKCGSVALLVFLWISSVANCSILMVAASRETFAFARDHGLPFSSYLRVLSSNKTPIRAISFVALCTLTEGLLMLINTIAINSIFNLAIMGLYFAYCMPLVSRLLFRNFTPGVWYMGDKISYISAVYSVVWMTFIFVLLLFPSYEDPNADEMNYAVVVLGFVLVFCTAYYWCPKYGGKTFFKGPVRTIDEILEERGDVRERVAAEIGGHEA